MKEGGGLAGRGSGSSVCSQGLRSLGIRRGSALNTGGSGGERRVSKRVVVLV